MPWLFSFSAKPRPRPRRLFLAPPTCAASSATSPLFLCLKSACKTCAALRWQALRCCLSTGATSTHQSFFIIIKGPFFMVGRCEEKFVNVCAQQPWRGYAPIQSARRGREAGRRRVSPDWVWLVSLDSSLLFSCGSPSCDSLSFLFSSLSIAGYYEGCFDRTCSSCWACSSRSIACRSCPYDDTPATESIPSEMVRPVTSVTCYCPIRATREFVAVLVTCPDFYSLRAHLTPLHLMEPYIRGFPSQVHLLSTKDVREIVLT